ncbi:MAG: sigma-70 family RNA polymerase sigma factor [Pirellulales bacterium]|nr:sigma-70 family RNA polymerase sigma factor [Pirellulales bacterium]
MADTPRSKPDDEDTKELLGRYQAGDDRAAEELFSRYMRRLISFANSRLSAKMARRVDPEDVVQSAYRSFFHHAKTGRYVIENSGDLWRLLVVITLNKLRQKVEFHTAGKRGINLEQSVKRDGSMARLAPQALNREPTPQEELGLIEEIEQLTEGMDELQRQIVELRLQGYRLEEIADEVSRSERTVRRVMDKVKTRLQQRMEESSQ